MMKSFRSGAEWASIEVLTCWCGPEQNRLCLMLAAAAACCCTSITSQDSTVRQIRSLPGLVLSGDLKVSGAVRGGGCCSRDWRQEAAARDRARACAACCACMRARSRAACRRPQRCIVCSAPPSRMALAHHRPRQLQRPIRMEDALAAAQHFARSAFWPRRRCARRDSRRSRRNRLAVFWPRAAHAGPSSALLVRSHRLSKQNRSTTT